VIPRNKSIITAKLWRIRRSTFTIAHGRPTFEFKKFTRTFSARTIASGPENKVTIKITLDKISLNVTPDLIGGELRLVNLNGQTSNSFQINDVNTDIFLEQFTTGVYFLEAIFNDGILSRRVYVK
jgi:hypothetical protein